MSTEDRLSKAHFAATEQGSVAWLSWAKFLAITGVVTIHVVGFNAIADDASVTNIGRLAIALDAFAVFAVPLFVMISGALLLDPSRYRGDADFLKRRAARLVPAIIFWHGVYWVVRRFLEGHWTPPLGYVKMTLNGAAFQGLYYLWIILGLCLVTPLVMPWVAQASRRRVVIVGLALSAMPILTTMTYRVRGATDVWIETPWTWWIFYSGLYVLGWALRGLVVRNGTLVLLVLLIAAVGWVTVWAWRNPAAPGWLAVNSNSYYALLTYVLTIAIFVALRNSIRQGGVLAALARGRLARVGHWLGGLTLGVFTIHVGAIPIMRRLGVLGHEKAVDSIGLLLLRIVVVLVLSYVIAAAFRRLPLLKRVV